jgi:hypothetical protein
MRLGQIRWTCMEVGDTLILLEVEQSLVPSLFPAIGPQESGSCKEQFLFLWRC